jgi:hypothetical protein
VTVQQCGVTQCGYLDVTWASIGEWGLSRTKVCSGAVGVLRMAMSGSRQGIGRGSVGLHRVPFVTRCDRGCLMFTDVYLTVNLG